MILNIYSDKNPAKNTENNSIEINQLDEKLYPNHSVNEIFLDEVLSYTDKDSFSKCLTFCLLKIRLGGTITIRDLDLDSIALGFVNKTIDTVRLNELVSTRNQLHSAQDIKKIVMSQNMLIDSLTLSDTHYTLKCKNNG
jgi:hypothetical protein